MDLNEFQMTKTLQAVAKSEKINLPDHLIESIIEKSDRNMRRAVLMLESAHVHQ